MTLVPGAYISTLRPPQEYTDEQIDLACRIASALHRGRFVLTVRPERWGS